MSNEELDPEVVADLKLRAYSQFDKTRTGEANYNWKPPAIATQWKCRTPPCKAFVDVPVDTLDDWAMFNAQLKRTGEKAIGSHEVLWCDACRAEMARIQPMRLRKRVDRMASVIQQIKAGDKTIRYRSNDGEVSCDQRAAIAQLRIWGHPDVDGLIGKLAEISKGSSTKRERRGGM